MGHIYTIGVDPGIKGAIALLYNGKVIHDNGVIDIPTMADGKGSSVVKQCVNSLELFNWVTQWLPMPDECTISAAIERVHAMPKQGVSSSFGFGQAYGAIRSVVQCAKLPTVLVTPQEWKKYFSLSNDKEQARSLAIQMFPEAVHLLSRKKDKDRAEALLIAYYHYIKGFRHERK